MLLLSYPKIKITKICFYSKIIIVLKQSYRNLSFAIFHVFFRILIFDVINTFVKLMQNSKLFSVYSFFKKLHLEQTSGYSVCFLVLVIILLYKTVIFYSYAMFREKKIWGNLISRKCLKMFEEFDFENTFLLYFFIYLFLFYVGILRLTTNLNRKYRTRSYNRSRPPEVFV